MSNDFRVRTTPKSIVIESNGEHVAEYASEAPKADAAKMRRTIKRHISNGGTILNYQW